MVSTKIASLTDHLAPMSLLRGPQPWRLGPSGSSMASLGRVDGFDQDESSGDRDEGAEVLLGFLAA